MSHSLSHPVTTHAAKRAVGALDPSALRAQIIAELNIAHLTEDEQNQIIEALGDVLLDRATAAVLDAVPEKHAKELDLLAAHGSDTLLQQKLRELVPNIDTVIAAAVREGIEEHKRLVAERVAQ